MEQEVLEKNKESTENGSTVHKNGADAPDVQQSEEEKLISQLRQEVAAEKARADENYDKLQRAVADGINARRRMEKKLEDEISQASAHIVRRLLPVIDDLDLAFRNAPEVLPDGLTNWFNGIRQIQKKLDMLLEEQQVIKFADEGMLDPTRHEAVYSEPREGKESGAILETIRPGYEIKGRILRPALVKVAA